MCPCARRHLVGSNLATRPVSPCDSLQQGLPAARRVTSLLPLRRKALGMRVERYTESHLGQGLVGGCFAHDASSFLSQPPCSFLLLPVAEFNPHFH